MAAEQPDTDSVCAQWLAAAREGDDAAARALVEHLYPRVACRIARWLPRRAEVEDLAQEIFLRVFSRLGQFRGGSFPAWVDTIAQRVCYDALRRQRVRPEWRFADLPEDPAEPVSGNPTDDPDAAEVVGRLLAQLPPPQAWLLQQVELEGRDIGQVSAALGWTATAGRLRLFRARHALKRAYERWKTQPAE